VVVKEGRTTGKASTPLACEEDDTSGEDLFSSKGYGPRGKGSGWAAGEREKRERWAGEERVAQDEGERFYFYFKICFQPSF
jgi:hypothetical protein